MCYSLLIGNESCFFFLSLLLIVGWRIWTAGKTWTCLDNHIRSPSAVRVAQIHGRKSSCRYTLEALLFLRSLFIAFSCFYSSLLIIRHQISEIDLRSPPVVRSLSRSFSAWLLSPINDALAATGQLGLLPFPSRPVKQWRNSSRFVRSFFSSRFLANDLLPNMQDSPEYRQEEQDDKLSRLLFPAHHHPHLDTREPQPPQHWASRSWWHGSSVIVQIVYTLSSVQSK